MGSSGLRTRFVRDGYVHVPGLLGAADVETLITAVTAAAEDPLTASDLTLGTMRFASNLYRRSPALQDFLSSHHVIDLVREIRDEAVWVRWDQAVWKDRGAPTFPLHQDNGYTGLDSEHLQLWVALTAMDASNGGLRVCPGHHLVARSHQSVGHHLRTSAPGPVLPLDVGKGDIVLFSSFLPHETSPNSTSRPRLAYVAEYLPVQIPDRSVAPPHFVADPGSDRARRWQDLTGRWR